MPEKRYIFLFWFYKAQKKYGSLNTESFKQVHLGARLYEN